MVETLEACPVCVSRGPFSLIYTINNYMVLRCQNCDLEFSHPMHCQIKYYEDLYCCDDPNLEKVLNLSGEFFLSKAKRLSEDINWQPYNFILQWISNNFQRGSTVLDIGCGVGWFMAVLKSKGFNPIGIEVSGKLVNMLNEKGLQAYFGPLESLHGEIPMPALIVLFGVIEHVEDPVGLLKCIRERFPKAILLLSIPNPKKWSSHYSEFPPNHLTPSWSEKSLKIALKRSRFYLKEWFYPDISCDEIWFFLLDRLFLKLGLRKKGYFLGLTSIVGKNSTFFEIAIRTLYRALERLNALLKYIARPLLRVLSRRFKRKGYSASSALVIAYPC